MVTIAVDHLMTISWVLRLMASQAIEPSWRVLLPWWSQEVAVDLGFPVALHSSASWRHGGLGDPTLASS